MTNLKAFCPECGCDVRIPIADVTLRDEQVVAVCPVGNHYSCAPVSERMAIKLERFGVRSLADECSEWLGRVTR